MTKKSTKSKLISSLLLLTLCVTMFAGSTYAWFTDEVVSAGNKIQAGTLDIELYQKADTMTEDQKAGLTEEDGYMNISKSTKPIFDYTLWEPGYTDVNILKVKNAGTLALKWSADLIASGSVLDLVDTSKVKLSDVIDVYVTTDPAEVSATPSDFNTIKADWEKYGTLTEYILNVSNLTEGLQLEANQEAVLGIALHMQEEAGNEYQGLDLGGTFDILIHADQLAFEKDSFGPNYDKDAADVPYAGVAQVTPKPEWTIFNMPLVNDPYFDDEITLEVAYSFQATDLLDEVTYDHPYGHWHADFVVSFDKDVKAGDIALAGNYGEYGWLGFQTPKDLAAGEKIRLLDYARQELNIGDNDTFYIDYYELCNGVIQFMCGADNIKGIHSGTTVTVELNLYEVKDKADSAHNSWNEETGKSITAGTYTYTFQ